MNWLYQREAKLTLKPPQPNIAFSLDSVFPSNFMMLLQVEYVTSDADGRTPTSALDGMPSRALVIFVRTAII